MKLEQFSVGELQVESSLQLPSVICYLVEIPSYLDLKLFMSGLFEAHCNLTFGDGDYILCFTLVV